MNIRTIGRDTKLSRVELAFMAMMPTLREGAMGSDSDRIDDVADTVDELKRTVEELADDPNTDQHALRDLNKAIEKAADATEELADDLEGK